MTGPAHVDTRRPGKRRRVVCVIAMLASQCLAGFTQDTRSAPVNSQIPGPACLQSRPIREGPPLPCSAADYAAWLADVTHWREERRIRTGFDDARYGLPALQWTQSSFIQPQVMVYDLYLYDPVAGHYTVSRYLNDVDRRYGGVDAVLLWPTYPNLGVDDRNQLDMISSMPGGVDGVARLVEDFHRRQVRVLFPMMLWDEGTHNPGSSWPNAIAALMKRLDADGVNGDTQDGVPLVFSTAAEADGHPLAFQPEHGPSDEALGWNVMTWGQYQFPFVPMVDRYKWLEPRHMVNISDRWRRDKTDDLQFAFFNGVGWESWEDIWGIWNGITPRDSEATRRVATLERGLSNFLTSAGWQPFYSMLQYGVFASRWPRENETVWTIVNRNDYEVDGEQFSVPHRDGVTYLDLYRGAAIAAKRIGDQDVISFHLEEHGFGAVAAVPIAKTGEFQELMQKMAAMTSAPLSSFPNAWHPLAQHMLPIAPAVVKEIPDGMIALPADEFTFTVRGVEVEGGNDAGVDVQYGWEQEARRYHRHTIQIPAFYLDRYPVTNGQYKQFLNATHYNPPDRTNFLRDWHEGNYPAGGERWPVIWVSREDAEAYARWAGKRLPHEWEWQYAAQGQDGRIYPWGNVWSSSAVPVPQRARVLGHPDDVNAHPQGASSFGIEDLVGNVWQWTDLYEDDHTRAAILRGGSSYQPQGSIWYFPQAYRNDEHGKYLLMAPSMDRSATIGFRCAADRK